MSARRSHVRIGVLGRFITPLGEQFVSVEALSAVVLLLAATVALVWANSPGSDTYASLRAYEITLGWGSLSITTTLVHWVNDGLMALFFFVVGLEIKREFVEGELRDRAQARLPIAAAAGGMLVPAVIYLAWNPTGPAARGWGIPMATDLAFALGALAVLGSRVPRGLKVFLLTLAIVDDIGAIVVVAAFYSDSIAFGWLGGALAVLAAIVAMRFVFRHPVFYVVPGVLLWLCVWESGVHATIAGVVLGLLTPAGVFRGRRVLDQFERRLHPWTSFLVVPVFAVANAGVALGADALRTAASSPITWGLATGLVGGKIVGVVGVTAIGSRLRVGRLPDGLRFRQILGLGTVAGIGFTVSLFIAELSFTGARLDEAKIGILTASVFAAAIGTATLGLSRPSRGDSRDACASHAADESVS
jgi:Na+:H+ antiporter, NhaA family